MMKLSVAIAAGRNLAIFIYKQIPFQIDQSKSKSSCHEGSYSRPSQEVRLCTTIVILKVHGTINYTFYATYHETCYDSFHDA